MSRRIYRGAERYAILGLKYDAGDTPDDYDGARFQGERLPDKPVEPIKPEIPEKKNKKSIKKYKIETREYNKKISKYNEELAVHAIEVDRINKLSPRPDVEEILAIRSEIGIVSRLCEKVDLLVPGFKAEWVEDDYYATVVDPSEKREMPSLETLLSLETEVLYEKKQKKFEINMESDIERNEIVTPRDRDDLALGRMSSESIAGINAKIDVVEAKRSSRISRLESATTLAEIKAV